MPSSHMKDFGLQDHMAVSINWGLHFLRALVKKGPTNLRAISVLGFWKLPYLLCPQMARENEIEIWEGADFCASSEKYRELGTPMMEPQEYSRNMIDFIYLGPYTFQSRGAASLALSVPGEAGRECTREHLGSTQLL